MSAVCIGIETIKVKRVRNAINSRNKMNSSVSISFNFWLNGSFKVYLKPVEIAFIRVRISREK